VACLASKPENSVKWFNLVGTCSSGAVHWLGNSAEESLRVFLTLACGGPDDVDFIFVK
jgi:hypothetical protein